MCSNPSRADAKLFSIYYANEKKPDGNEMGAHPDGDAHADFFYELATKAQSGEFDQTFVERKGYVKF